MQESDDMAMIRQVDVLKKTIEELNINISRLHADNDKLRDEVHIVRTERRKSETVCNHCSWLFVLYECLPMQFCKPNCH